MKGNLLHSILEYYSLNWAFLLELFFKHLLMSVYGVLFACIIGIPIGIFIAKYKRLSWPIITIANIIQTVPAIAMLAILMLAMGLGPTTVVVTVFLYSLLPIIKNTYTGIVEVDDNIKDAGKGMGMTGNQILRMIELPLSLSCLLYTSPSPRDSYWRYKNRTCSSNWYCSDWFIYRCANTWGYYHSWYKFYRWNNIHFSWCHSYCINRYNY